MNKQIVKVCKEYVKRNIIKKNLIKKENNINNFKLNNYFIPNETRFFSFIITSFGIDFNVLFFLNFKPRVFFRDFKNLFIRS